MFCVQYHPNPDRSPSLKLKFFEFAGRVVGKCVFESAMEDGSLQHVKARFTRSFLAQLIGLHINHKVLILALVFCCLITLDDSAAGAC